MYDLFSDQFITITAIIVGGSAVIAIATMITITVTIVACFIAAKKRKQRNSSDYNYTATLTYNIIRNGQVDMEDENERNPESQPPSTVPYYDYIEDGTPRQAGSRERILSSCESGGSMVQNRAYRSHQEADLHNTSVSSHSMVQNHAYRSHQDTDLHINNNASVSMVQNRAYL